MPNTIEVTGGTLIYVEAPTGGHSVYWELPDRFNTILDALLTEAYGRGD